MAGSRTQQTAGYSVQPRAGFGQVVQHVHVVAARSRLAHRYARRAPGLADEAALAMELAAFFATHHRHQQPVRRRLHARRAEGPRVGHAELEIGR